MTTERLASGWTVAEMQADSWAGLDRWKRMVGEVMAINENREKLRLTQEYRVGIRPDGRYCLACGKPLYGPELSHTPPAQPSAVDRWRHG